MPNLPTPACRWLVVLDARHRLRAGSGDVPGTVTCNLQAHVLDLALLRGPLDCVGGEGDQGHHVGRHVLRNLGVLQQFVR